MFWDDSDKGEFVVPDDVVDVSFRLNGGRIRIDHAWGLSQALLAKLPWLEQEPAAGIHDIHIPEAGNGWMRPDRESEGWVYLSKRTRISLRLPKHRVDDAKALENASLDLGEASVDVGKLSKIKLLSSLTTVFSRYVVCVEEESDAAFVQRCANELKAEFGIRVRKMLPGKRVDVVCPDRVVSTRSLMVSDLEPEESVRLQERGLGPDRLLGCGLFIPHKGIDAVYKKESDE